ncbi:uncharacterized protein [Centruroides vittatus]|uniref:uncharacterized protein n=1 Tax=Centruroides vittatus TaxID=120091 RepID=UPI00350F3D3C
MARQGKEEICGERLDGGMELQDAVKQRKKLLNFGREVSQADKDTRSVTRQFKKQIARDRPKARRDILESNVLRNEEGIVLTQEQIIRWRECFNKLLNEENERGTLEDTEKNLMQEEDLTREEVENAVRAMKSGKAGGPSGVVIEMFKAIGPGGRKWIFDILKRSWTEEKIPDE